MSSDDNERGLKAAEAESLNTTTSPENINGDLEKQEDKPTQSVLVEWDGDSDPLDPRTFSSSRKWFYVAVVSTGSLLV
jgi:hypothetical protein